MMRFRGSIVALVTPFKNGSFDDAAYKKLIEWHIQSGTQAIVPCGTTGESATVSHEENEHIIDLCVKTVAGRVPVIAGTGSNSTEEAISLTLFAQKAGADAALVVTPYYNKPTQRGLLEHYRKLHDETDIPIIIYNIPGRCIIDMTAETMGELAELPRIVGVKDSTGDITRPLETTSTCGPDFSQLSGEDGNCVAFRAHGGHGCISVTANVAPKLCADMHKAMDEGDFERAIDIHRRLWPLHQALFIEANPAPAKYALSLLGLIQPEVRLPLVETMASTREAVRKAVEHAGLLESALT